VTDVEDRDQRFRASTIAPARVESVRASAAFLVLCARSLGIARAADPLFETAVAEAITNAVQHGGGPDTWMVCELEWHRPRLVVRVLDPGPGFTWQAAGEVPEPPAEVADISESGYGLQIIQAVFPEARTVRRAGLFGLEMPLSV
jgi:anti-sigma regulatory factor (Ser/Thr protein kinase)